MAMNPASIFKIMSAKNKFTSNHPKFASFMQMLFSRPMEEGTVLEVTITRPGESPITSNFVVKQEDLELLEELKGLA